MTGLPIAFVPVSMKVAPIFINPLFGVAETIGEAYVSLVFDRFNCFSPIIRGFSRAPGT